jgi:hypothetical protein
VLLVLKSRIWMRGPWWEDIEVDVGSVKMVVLEEGEEWGWRRGFGGLEDMVDG